MKWTNVLIICLIVSLINLSKSIGVDYKKKYALEINKNTALSNINIQLKEDVKDADLKTTKMSNIAGVEKEKKEVWKDAYKREANKNILENIVIVLVAVGSAIAGMLAGK